MSSSGRVRDDERASADRLRDDARAILDAAIAAADPARRVRAWIEGSDTEAARALRAAERVHLVAVGKAAPRMADGALSALGDRLASGVVLTTRGTSRPASESASRLDVHFGAHPLPDSGGVEGARAVERLARGLGDDDHLLVLLSGGGSALLTLPADGLSLDDVRAATGALLRAGAGIREMNAVRKHLDRLKGGGLAGVAAPARVTALALSDVVGDPLDVIASGPVSPDPTTYADALAVVERRAPDAVPAAVRRHLERGAAGEHPDTPAPGDGVFDRVFAAVVGANVDALSGATAEAEARGYHTLVLSGVLEGEAREIGGALAAVGLEIALRGRPAPRPACVLAGGETTVTVTGTGRGGRNLELALGAALALDRAEAWSGSGADGARPSIVVASIGTDGIDGSSDAAGAVVDHRTVEGARAIGLEPLDALRDNDTDGFFRRLDDHLITTGPTGTNVMDVQVVLVDE